MPGDKNFLWYWGPGADPEGFHGPFQSGDAAQADARSKRPEGDFCVVEADKAVPDHRVFNAEQLVALYEEKNAGCWGEDGLDAILTPGEIDELEQKLGDCFARWLRRHGLHRGPGLNEVLNKDYFPATAAKENVA